MDNYYIIIEDLCNRHSPEEIDYHLERVLDYQIQEIIEKVINHRENYLIITDEEELLSSYIFVLSLDDFKLLCGQSDFNREYLRVDINYYKSNSSRISIKYDCEKVYKYFKKIYDNEIISASIGWEYKTYTWGDYGYSKDVDESLGWLENHNFYFLEVPKHYKNRKNKYSYSASDTNLLKIHYHCIWNLEELNKILNVDLLSLTLDGDRESTWSYLRNGIYKYFDWNSFCRLFISETICNLLREDEELYFKVKTVFTKNHYIEYYITELRD